MDSIFVRVVGLLAAAMSVASLGGALAQAPQRVETAVALAQVIKKVDPEIPAEAVAAKLGGVVIADVTIGPDGAVSALTILSGAPMLHAAAERALRQWTFKPFLAAGRPHPVRVILEVTFPDAVKDEENRVYEAYRASSYACQRQLQVDASKAEPPCAEAMRAADALPPDRVLERAHAVGDHAEALLLSGRIREAMAQFERALAIRETKVKEADADNAAIHYVLAKLHERLGEFTKADGEFATSIETYTGAIELVPSLRQLYEPRLQQALVGYAQLKRSQGDTSAAKALDERALAIGRASESTRAAEGGPRRARVVGQLQVVEPSDAELTTSDLDEIATVVTRAGHHVWRLDADVASSSGHPRSWFVFAFEEPESASPAFRRGGVGVVTCGDAAGGGCRGWKYGPASAQYVQVASRGRDAASEPPILVEPSPNLPPPSDDDVISVVTWVHEHAAPASTDRLFVDIQPWPIRLITGWGTERLSVSLRDPARGDCSQRIALQRKNGQWFVVELR